VLPQEVKLFSGSMALQEDIFRLFLSMVGRVAACSQCDAERSLGPALDPCCICRHVLLCSAHPCPWLGSPTANPCTADISGAWWLGLFWLGRKPGWPHWPPRANFSRPFAAGSESKQAALQALFPPRKFAESKLQRPEHADIAPACAAS
jgi:hypothetical protein